MKTSNLSGKKWLVTVLLVVLVVAGCLALDYTGLLQQIWSPEAASNKQLDGAASQGTAAAQAGSEAAQATGSTAAQGAGGAGAGGSQAAVGPGGGAAGGGEGQQAVGPGGGAAGGGEGQQAVGGEGQQAGAARPLTTDDASLSVRPESVIYIEMHKMANTKIVADQIWGEIAITKDKVDALIDEISRSDFADKDVLLNMLYNWQKGNFSNAVNEHNYLWGKLDGTVGKAYGLK